MNANWSGPLPLWASKGKVLSMSRTAYQVPSVCAVDSAAATMSGIAGAAGVTT